MLSRIFKRLANDSRGFMLVEVLVAATTGVIVLGAAYAVLNISLKESGRISDVSEVNQHGRSTMAKIVDELHSACVSREFTPVREGSSPEKLVLRSAYSEASEITGAATSKEGGREDIIEWKKEAAPHEETGKLVDTTYLSTEGTAPNFVIPHGETNVIKRTIGERIKPAGEVEVSTTKVKQKLIFRYYQFATKSTTNTSEPSSTLTEVLPAGKEAFFTKEEAAKIASVAPTFTQLPRDWKEEVGRSADFSSQVTFAFSAPSTEAKIEAAACE